MEKTMRRMHIPPWPLVVAALLVPAALQAQAGTVVCRDGSNGSNPSACAQHGGVDSITTSAAQRARGAAPGVETGRADTAAKDTGQTGGQAGVKTDTALKAKPGLQTGKTKRHHKRATADSLKTQADTAMTRPDSTH
jgi:hypothetical protein